MGDLKKNYPASIRVLVPQKIMQKINAGKKIHASSECQKKVHVCYMDKKNIMHARVVRKNNS